MEYPFYKGGKEKMNKEEMDKRVVEFEKDVTLEIRKILFSGVSVVDSMEKIKTLIERNLSTIEKDIHKLVFLVKSREIIARKMQEGSVEISEGLLTIRIKKDLLSIIEFLHNHWVSIFWTGKL